MPGACVFESRSGPCALSFVLCSEFISLNGRRFSIPADLAFDFLGEQLLGAYRDDLVLRFQTGCHEPAVIQWTIQRHLLSLEILLRNLPVDPGHSVEPHDRLARQ